MPSHLPFSSGSTSDTALAAPVVVGDDREAGGAPSALVLVGRVEDHLILGVRAYGGHEPRLDTEGVVEDLGDRGEAVGSARRVGDNVVLGRVV